jgi:triacylglycerol esterase/lipase EstA (alpha/beta hydrolase family)
MGGLACRAYLRRNGNGRVAKLVTLGSAHRGTLLAPLGLGRNAFQMRIGGAWLRELEAGDQLPPDTVSVLSHQDNYVFPPAVASRLEGARHRELGGVSHLAMVLSPKILGLLRDELESSEAESMRVAATAVADRPRNPG